MSTLVLARKYRPRDFETLVGQPHVVQALANALTQQRLHHAYLFTGTRGVGKTTISRILAKALNCTGADGTGGITAQPCGVCPACRDIDSGRYIDYVELDAASNRGVDEISQLLDQAVYKPVVGRFKVYMIDEVHMLSNHAFNAMLKSLEEPPEYLKFVLATTDPQKVPPTVLSRCLQFNLRPLAPQTVHEHLADVLQQEGIAAEAPALQLIARAARGSMRDGLSLADQAIAHGGGSIDEAGVRQMLGAVDRSHAVRLVEALAARDGAETIAAINGLRGLGLSAAGALEEIATLLQQMAVHQAVPEALDPSDPDASTQARLAALLDADETQLLYSIALHGRAELPLAPDEYSGLVMVLLRFLAFPPSDRRPVSNAPPARPGATVVRVPEAASVARAPKAASAPPRGAVPASPSASYRAMAASSDAPTVAPHAASMPAASGPPMVTDAPSPEGAIPVSTAEVVMPAAASASPKAPDATDVPNPTSPRPPRADDEPPAWVEAPDEAAVATAPMVARGAAPLARTTASATARTAAPLPRPSDRSAASRVAPATPAGLERSTPAPYEPRAADDGPGRNGRGREIEDRPAVERADDGKRASATAARVEADPGDDGADRALGDRWAATVAQLTGAGAITALVRELATQAECTALDEGASPPCWRLRVEREMLRAPAQCEKLQAALGHLLGRPVRLEVEAGEARDTPSKRDAAERARRQAEAERTIRDDPLVQALMTQYKTARIVPGSVRSN